MLKKSRYLFILSSCILIIISSAGTYYFLNAQGKKEPILEFIEDFKTKDYINENYTSLNLILDKGMVHLPFNYAENISSYINNLPDFRRIKAIGTNGNKFLIAADSHYLAGIHANLLEYNNGKWKNLTPALDSILNTRGLDIQVIGWGENYWLIGGNVFHEDYSGYFLIKYENGNFIDLTKFLPKGDYSLNINSLSYAPQKGWLIGAWYNNGSYLIKYDGGKKFELILDSQYMQGANRGFQVKSIDTDGKYFVIGGTHSTVLVLLYHDNQIGNAFASVKQILGTEWGSIISIKLDKNIKHYSRWLLVTSRGPILEYDLALLKKADDIYGNFYTSYYADMEFKNGDLLVITTEDEKSGKFTKIKISGEKIDLSPIIPQTDLAGLRFISVGNDRILSGNSKNLYEIIKPQLFLNSGIVQSKPISKPISWYKTIRKVKLNYEGEIKDDPLEDISVNFYLSTNNARSWQEFSQLDEFNKVDTERRYLMWKAEFFSRSGDKSPYLAKISIYYQLGFSNIFVIILIVSVIAVELILITMIYRFLISKERF